MFEINMEPWEKLPEGFEEKERLIQTLCYLPMPQDPQPGQFYRIYPQGCVSGNGTAYHGGLRIGAKPKKLLVYFNGGGVAFDEYSVSRPWNLFTSQIKDTYYSNDGEWIGDYFLSKGLNTKREDNPFLEWSVINLLYCNGDFHCGNGDFPYQAQDGSRRSMPFHGYQNAIETIKMAKQWLPQPEELVIAGSSAGGFGTALLADDVIDLFPGCKNVTVCVDSALLVTPRWRQIQREMWHTPAHIQSRTQGENLTLDNLLALYQKRGDRVKYLFACSARDALLTAAQSALDGQGQTFDAARGVQFQQRLRDMCQKLTAAIPHAGLYIFTGPMDAPGYDADDLTLHCTLNNPSLFEHREEGLTSCDWLLEAVKGNVRRVGRSNL